MLLNFRSCFAYICRHYWKGNPRAQFFTQKPKVPPPVITAEEAYRDSQECVVVRKIRNPNEEEYCREYECPNRDSKWC